MIVTASMLPERPRRRAEEQQLQRSVVQQLRQALPAGSLVFHIPNGGQRSKRTGGILAGQGVVPGMPDLCICTKGSPDIYLELKTPRGSLSSEQRDVHRQLTWLGRPVLVCRTPECVETGLRELGVPLRGRIAA